VQASIFVFSILREGRALQVNSCANLPPPTATLAEGRFTARHVDASDPLRAERSVDSERASLACLPYHLPRDFDNIIGFVHAHRRQVRPVKTSSHDSRVCDALLDNNI
jgi:hypothetical protein